jgi:hypothetical protein
VTSGGRAARSAARSRAAGASASAATRTSGARISPNGMSSASLQITMRIAMRSSETQVFLFRAFEIREVPAPIDATCDVRHIARMDRLALLSRLSTRSSYLR